VEPRSHGAERHAQHFGDLRQGQVEVVLEDEDRALLRWQTAEPSLQLVAVGNGELRVSGAVIGLENVK
jgi:hypothetical protein